MFFKVLNTKKEILKNRDSQIETLTQRSELKQTLSPTTSQSKAGISTAGVEGTVLSAIEAPTVFSVVFFFSLESHN
jgi:hypothetical protein